LQKQVPRDENTQGAHEKTDGERYDENITEYAMPLRPEGHNGRPEHGE
jgi:hypothetical protein